MSRSTVNLRIVLLAAAGLALAAEAPAHGAVHAKQLQPDPSHEVFGLESILTGGAPYGFQNTAGVVDGFDSGYEVLAVGQPSQEYVDFYLDPNDNVDGPHSYTSAAINDGVDWLQGSTLGYDRVGSFIAAANRNYADPDTNIGALAISEEPRVDPPDLSAIPFHTGSVAIVVGSLQPNIEYVRYAYGWHIDETPPAGGRITIEPPMYGVPLKVGVYLKTEFFENQTVNVGIGWKTDGGSIPGFGSGQKRLGEWWIIQSSDPNDPNDHVPAPLGEPNMNWTYFEALIPTRGNPADVDPNLIAAYDRSLLGEISIQVYRDTNNSDPGLGYAIVDDWSVHLVADITADRDKDGDVDFFDAQTFVNQYREAIATGPDTRQWRMEPIWFFADINLDNDVNFEDTLLFVNLFNGAAGPLSVPEPAALAVLASGGLMAALRRHR